VKTFGIWGGILIVIGFAIHGFYSSNNAACATSVGVAAQSTNASYNHRCVFDGFAVSIGLAVAVIGFLLALTAVALVFRAGPKPPYKPKPGWYKHPKSGEKRYWDGQKWTESEVPLE